MALPENSSIMLGTSIGLFRHLEHKNLSIISDSIIRNTILQKNEQEQEEKQEKEDDKSRRNLIDLEDNRVSVVILSWSLILEQSIKTLLKKMLKGHIYI